MRAASVVSPLFSFSCACTAVCLSSTKLTPFQAPIFLMLLEMRRGAQDGLFSIWL